MKYRHFLILAASFYVLLFSSCNKETLFQQPNIEVVAYRLLELPGEYVNLEIDIKVHNNDHREANIKDVEYQVVIEGVSAEEESLDIGEKILTSVPLELSLPLTLRTNDAIQLLSKLDAGESLEYEVTGTFHVDDLILELFDLPIDISGFAEVEAGFEDFYEQPEFIVYDMDAAYSSDGSNYIFDLDVMFSVHNLDSRSILADEIEYIVTVEDIPSNTHLYSESYSTDFLLEGNEYGAFNLPVTLSMDESQGANLAAAMNAGDINYVVSGKMHVIEIDGVATDFILPVYVEEQISANVLTDMFAQPSVFVTGYTLKELPGDTTYLDISMEITNNDIREAFITDVEYQVVVEGITALPEEVDINQIMPVDSSLIITLPLTLLTEDAVQILAKLDAGEELAYTATGTFHVDEPVLELFDLPIDITGIATVDVGYEDFYEQPEVTVTNIDAAYTINGFTSYTFNLEVDCTVRNVDMRNVTIDEVEYTAIIEGEQSSKHFYTDTYSTNIEIAGGGSIDLSLPVELTIGIASAPAFLAKLSDGTADYEIEGTFHAILVDGSTVDFHLPLYVTGNVPVTMVGK